jgi:NitT/TauT family transport system substrate-binding protein
MIRTILAAVLATCAIAQAEPIKLQLNWKPEPQFGGFYSAKDKGFFAKHGLDVEVVPGGSGTPTVQMVGAGRVDFATVSADEIVIARSRGNNVVALFAVYQINPQGIMTRASRGLREIGDIFRTPGTLAMQRGLPYASFLEKKFGFDKLRVVPSPFGDLSKYRTDENYAMQCFVTSEPLAAMKTGIEPKTFLIAEAGWNPYTTVLVTRDDYLRDHPDVVKSMVESVRQGWRAYLDDPVSTNQVMHKLNPTMELATFAESAEAQEILIETEPLGTMTLGRWTQLVGQMVELKLVERVRAPEPKDCFVGEMK